MTPLLVVVRTTLHGACARVNVLLEPLMNTTVAINPRNVELARHNVSFAVCVL